MGWGPRELPLVIIQVAYHGTGTNLFSPTVQLVRGTDLKILGLVGSDAGVYQCLATSPAGSIQAATQLRVKAKGNGLASGAQG